MLSQVCRDAPQLLNIELLGILPKAHSAPARRPIIPYTGVLGARDERRVPGLYSYYTTKASAWRQKASIILWIKT